MTLIPMAGIARDARARRHAIGAFNVITLEHAEGIVAGAEQAGRPVILQISQNTVRYHGGLAPLARACLQIADDAAGMVCVHLDHATEPDLIKQAVDVGMPSVMVDGAALPYEENVGLTAMVTAWCHPREVWVEAELGEVGGKDGPHAPGVRTDPDDAARFVAATNVDALAVAVGTSHAMLSREAVLDNALIAELAAKVPVPLVLHGSSGLPDAGLRAAVTNGIVKINIATHLNAVFAAAARHALVADESLVDPRQYLGPGRDALAGEVARLLTLLTPQ